MQPNTSSFCMVGISSLAELRRLKRARDSILLQRGLTLNCRVVGSISNILRTKRLNQT